MSARPWQETSTVSFPTPSGAAFRVTYATGCSSRDLLCAAEMLWPYFQRLAELKNSNEAEIEYQSWLNEIAAQVKP